MPAARTAVEGKLKDSNKKTEKEKRKTMSKKQLPYIILAIALALVALLANTQTVAAAPVQPPVTIEITANDPAPDCTNVNVWTSEIRLVLVCIMMRVDTSGSTYTPPQQQNPPPAGAQNPNLGVTDCATAEGNLATGTGTKADPVIYTDAWLHDLCYAWTNGHTGAKFIQVPGPAALQMGEATGPIRMVYVPSGLVYTGWTQGGWRYVTDAALLNQWKVESLEVGRYGLICGYSRNNRLFVPAYKWDGTQEVRDQTLDCEIPLSQLLGTTYGNTNTYVQPSSQNNPPAANNSGNNTGQSQQSQVGNQNAVKYVTLVKFEYGGTYYCGARAENAQFPSGYRHIEEHPDEPDYTSWLYKSGANSLSGFCSDSPSPHGAASGSTWTTVLVVAPNTLKPVSFPLAR